MPWLAASYACALIAAALILVVARLTSPRGR